MWRCPCLPRPQVRTSRPALRPPKWRHRRLRRFVMTLVKEKGIVTMHFYPNERLAIFIDGANLYATAKALGFDIDYKRLLALFRTKGLLVRALYYTALAEDQEYSSIRPLVDWLD